MVFSSGDINKTIIIIDEDHRRLDITCEHPKTHAKYVFDFVVWWGASQGLALTRDSSRFPDLGFCL
jgi:hypothetical protein